MKTLFSDMVNAINTDNVFHGINVLAKAKEEHEKAVSNADEALQ